MEKLKYLIIHCTATREGLDLTGEDVKRMHLNPVSKGGRGWKRPGYRLVIQRNGKIDRLVEVIDNVWVEEGEITNGAKGYNNCSHHICYVGGLAKDAKTAKDTRTDSQKETMREVVEWYLSKYPDIKVIGHNEVSNKACPSFDVQAWLRELKLE